MSKIADLMDYTLESEAEEDVQKGARGLVWDGRAVWVKLDSRTYILEAVDNGDTLVTVELHPFDIGTRDRFWKLVQS